MCHTSPRVVHTFYFCCFLNCPLFLFIYFYLNTIISHYYIFQFTDSSEDSSAHSCSRGFCHTYDFLCVSDLTKGKRNINKLLHVVVVVTRSLLIYETIQVKSLKILFIFWVATTIIYCNDSIYC